MIGQDVLTELEPVHNRWSRNSSSDDDDEPAWSEVVTEILLSLLAQGNHQLKEVVFCVFKALGKSHLSLVDS